MRFLVAAAAISLLPISANAQSAPELPQRRAGQWEIRLDVGAARQTPDMVIHHCTDAATDRRMMQAGLQMSREMCSRYEMRRDGQGFVIDATCQLGPARSTSRAVISGDFQASYTIRVEGSVEGMPGSRGPQASVVTQTARWVGAACREGLTPGDMLMPGGMKMNVRDLERMMGRGGG